jgi:hypothetical protein
MDALPKTYGDIEGFVTMLLAACDDAGMNGTLERLLSLPDARRQKLVHDLLAQFRQDDAPAFLVEAFAPLLDNQVAEKAYVVLYECKRKMDGAS